MLLDSNLLLFPNSNKIFHFLYSLFISIINFFHYPFLFFLFSSHFIILYKFYYKNHTYYLILLLITLYYKQIIIYFIRYSIKIFQPLIQKHFLILFFSYLCNKSFQYHLSKYISIPSYFPLNLKPIKILSAILKLSSYLLIYFINNI